MACISMQSLMMSPPKPSSPRSSHVRDAPRHGRRQFFRLQRREQHVAGHDGGDARLNGAAEGQQFAFLKLFPALLHPRQPQVRIHRGVAMPREMFAAGHHAAVQRPAHEAQRAAGGLFRLVAEAADAYDRVCRVGVYIQHRGQVEVYAHAAQLTGRDQARAIGRVTAGGGQRQCRPAYLSCPWRGG